ncbi:hypothetical protein [Mycobacterium sp. E1747]|uniref:hypothetical protein n=1 Tax=Mycobacterium sp. E1747 TaxID=1834128 RepID=UPI000B0FD785|nr:hypothetical protein [Mycobacterium sp. E1747]
MPGFFDRLATLPTQTFDLLSFIFDPGRPFFEPRTEEERAEIAAIRARHADALREAS